MATSLILYRMEATETKDSRGRTTASWAPVSPALHTKTGCAGDVENLLSPTEDKKREVFTFYFSELPSLTLADKVLFQNKVYNIDKIQPFIKGSLTKTVVVVSRVGGTSE